jgi:hypothetical protein
MKAPIKPRGAIAPQSSKLGIFCRLGQNLRRSSRETGNPFHTSLKPRNREASDMRDFPRFLTLWGWSL